MVQNHCCFNHSLYSSSVFTLYYIFDTCNAVNTPNLSFNEQFQVLQVTNISNKSSDLVRSTEFSKAIIYEELSFIVTRTMVDPSDYDIIAFTLEEIYEKFGKTRVLI